MRSLATRLGAASRAQKVIAGGHIWYGVVDANNRSGFVAMGGGTTPWFVPAD